MAEEIHGQLSKLSELQVLSRQAVERYEGGDVRRMATELGPVSVVSGSVRIDWGRARIAAIHAMRRENEEALQWLERAFDAGLRDHRTLARQPIFERLRREPRFTTLLGRMRADVAEMRRRANIPQTLSVLARWQGAGDLSSAAP